MSVRPAIVLLGVLVAACSTSPQASPTARSSGGPSTPPSTAPSEAPTASPAAAALVLRITSEGGFISPAANIVTIPEVSVYADGRILTPGPVDAIFPGPLLLPVQIKDVGPAGAQQIIAAIRSAGLDQESEAGPGIGNPDAGTQVYAVTLDGKTITTRIATGGGPGLPGHPGGGSPDPGAQAATELLGRLQDPNETWGSAAPIVSTLTPTAYRVFVAPGAPQAEGATSGPAVAWPLSTPLNAFGVPAVPDRGIPGLRQGAVLGADAATLGPVLAAANALTAFSSGGKLYTLYVRALLPDEVPAPG